MSDKTGKVRPNHVRARRGGFTLVEVLATITLIAIVLPAVMQGITMATGAGSVARQRNQAAALCESKVSELVATGNWSGGTLSGDFTADNPNDPDLARFTWQANLLSWPQDGDVQELDVTVRWTSSYGGERTVTMSTLVYQSQTSSSASSGGLP